ncbi:aminotransferase class IV family protein [Paracoccus sp. CPCC 101403]|uniref:Probable branched-chain-amino-acid aminotransferase n=1 Tax=Paracoccus broussonetiae TaxID=3075834 RepID=A0ABU3EJ49_9RHOB|nr:aminotransferase class IV family protein [Paracoccus sp. CPCC 101403]MDT1064254.1 aminotransferase class IV family protein [Paracoccus sp. CPCC 101403]
MEGALRGSGPDLRLIETLLWDGRDLSHLPRHLERLAASAARLGWRCDLQGARAALLAATPDGPARMRLTMDETGRMEVVAANLPPALTVWRVALSDRHLYSGDPWLRVKSTRRPVHDAARAALPAGIDEFLLANERYEVCEGTITNVFFDLGQGMRTPPLHCGLLPGTLRAELLETGQCAEAILPRADLARARLWIGNSLRGLVPAQLAG